MTAPRRGVAALTGVLLLGAAGAALAGYDSSDLETNPRPFPQRPDSAGSITTPGAGGERRARRPSRYEPGRNEADPSAKRVAGRIAQQLTTYGADATATEIAGRVTHPRGSASLAAAARPLISRGDRSRGEVLYAQLGGRTASAMAIMVVIRQRLGSERRGDRVSVRTLDVRLRRAGREWRFERLASAGGWPQPRPANLSSVARAVVDNPRIRLPDSARWDIFRGKVNPRLLATMSDMACRSSYAVGVISTGHPRNVFGTRRRSDHPDGDAVDIYAVGERPVVRQRGFGTPAHKLARRLIARGVRQLGSPWVLAPAATSFTDAVHQDHLHVAVGRGMAAGSGRGCGRAG